MSEWTLRPGDPRLIAEADALYPLIMDRLRDDERFSSALAAGDLTEAACTAIAVAFEAVFDRQRRLANILLTDRIARDHLTRFWFARAYAEVHADVAYRAAFRATRVALKDAAE